MLDVGCAAILAVLLSIALFNLATAPRLHRLSPRNDADSPRVSILVPARDEAANLRRTLPLLLASRYRPMEILILDDESRDETAAVVRSFAAAADVPLRLLHGSPRPPGWLGKNWACQQLADEAQGDVLLFCDADVAAGPDAVGRTVAAFEGGDVVTALPHQQLPGLATAAVTPLIMHVAVAALLPLRLIPRLRSRSLLVANGQWLALPAQLYRAIGGHAAVREQVVEDMALGRRVVAAGGRVLPLVASRDLEVRMYESLDDLRAGFGKNLYPLLGGRPLALLAGLVLLATTMALPFLLGPASLAFWMLAGLRVTITGLFRQGLRPVLLHPLGVALVSWIAVESALAHRRGTVHWKGRTVRIEPSHHDGPAGLRSESAPGFVLDRPTQERV